MAHKRLLYMTANRLQAFAWKSGTLAADGAFENNDEGVAKFARYVSGSPGSLYYFVPDVVEEDFFQENLPYVRGRDRRALLGRKLAQRYRDTSLALTLTLGTQAGERREERVLFSSFTNTQQFQPWLTALSSSEARLAGVYSFALIAPVLAKRIKFAVPRFVMMSFLESGLRQSYVENGQIRFSRLGRANRADPRAAAETCAVESARIEQYLVNLRIMPREAGQLDIVVMVPAAQLDIYQAACVDNPQLKFHIIDLETAGRNAGLKSAPEALLSERLFLHVLADTPPSKQFASDAQRRFYNIWRAQVALYASGAAACALCLLAAGFIFVHTSGVNAEAERARQQEAEAAQQYNSLQANFPKTPLPREALKAAVGTFNTLSRQTASPDRLFAEISAALSAAPQVEIDRLDWGVSNNPRSLPNAAAAAAPPRSPPTSLPPVPAGGAPQPAADAHFEVIQISAHVTGVKGSDYRGIKAVTDPFVEALRQRPGVAITDTQMPFDFIGDRAISGGAGEDRSDEEPRFTVTIGRRIGT
jgi:hypothetical protein